MKILFVNSLAETELGGGAEVIVWEQIRGLAEKGHECVLLATTSGSGLTVTDKGGIRVWQAGLQNLYWPAGNTKRPSALSRLAWHVLDSYNLLMQHYVRRVALREQPDVGSLHNLAGWSSTIYNTLSLLNVPIAQVLHDYYLICVKSSMRSSGANCAASCRTCRAFRLPHRAQSRQASAVVGVSRFVLERHARLGYFHGVPIKRVIHNTRDARTLDIEVADRASSRQALRFGYIGTLSESKGPALLIDAFQAADLGQATLWLAGSGQPQYADSLRERARDARIVFKGRMQPADFFSKVDVVVVPSLWHDNLPGVVFEALAFGKPVVASNRGGIPEMISDGYNGLLFEPDNDGELAERLRMINDDAALRTRLTANAKPSSAPFFDYNGWIDQYERLYGEVAAAGVST